MTNNKTTPQFETLHLIPIFTHHDEHTPPITPLNRVEVHWDGFKLIEFLESTGAIHEAIEHSLTLEYQARFGSIETIISDPYNYTGRILYIRVWDSDLDEYTDKFASHCQERVTNAGADDDIFDYVPDLLDQFRQYCQYLDMPAPYNRLIEEILAQQGPDTNLEPWKVSI